MEVDKVARRTAGREMVSEMADISNYWERKENRTKVKSMESRDTCAH